MPRPTKARRGDHAHRHRQSRGATCRPAAASGPTTWCMARNGLLYVSDWADRARAGRRSRIAAHDRPHSRRRASQPDRPASRGRPALRGLRLEQRRVGDRHASAAPCTETIFTALFPQVARREHARRPGHRARRQDAVRRQRRQQLRRRDRHRGAEHAARCKGFIPTGWYPTAVAVTPDGKQLLVGVGKGNQTQAEPARRRTLEARTRSRPAKAATAAFHSRTSAPRSRARCRSSDVPTRSSWPRTPTRSIATVPTPTSCSPPRRTPRKTAIPDQGRRPVADQARDLHHQGEPHLRPGVRRHRREATAIRAW